MLSHELEKYLEDHTSEEDELLKSLNRQTNIKTTLPRMLSGKVQGMFLTMISQMISPNRILEIGTFTGYSAFCLAKGLSDSGLLYTIESNHEMEDFIQEYLRKSDYRDKIKLIIGDALTEIPKLNDKFDLVFIDADKKQYLQYYLGVKKILRKGGYIIVDNVLWSGKVLNNQNNDIETKSLIDFNHFVKHDKEVEQVMLSIRDGLLVIRKLQ
jgi:predicted O-methyltransferase YrrM